MEDVGDDSNDGTGFKGDPAVNGEGGGVVSGRKFQSKEDDAYFGEIMFWYRVHKEVKFFKRYKEEENKKNLEAIEGKGTKGKAAAKGKATAKAKAKPRAKAKGKAAAKATAKADGNSD